MASRNSVVNSSSDGKTLSSSASCVYIEISTIVSAIARLTVISMSSSTAGSGSTIITTTMTTADARRPRSACFRTLSDHAPGVPGALSDGDGRSDHAHASSRREVRYT